MDITQRKDIIVFVLIIILAFLIGRNIVYKYNLNTIDSIKSQIEEEKKKNDILGVIGVLDRKLKAYQERSFSTTEITPLLNKISDIAEGLGLKIETYNPQPAVYREQYIELPVKIPLRCEFHKLGRFLSLFENNQEFIWVKELHMQKSTVTEAGEIKIPKIDLVVSGLYLKK